MDEQIVELFDTAQRRAISMLGEVLRGVEPGMGARDVKASAADLLGKHGFNAWFRPPEVWIGPPATEARPRRPAFGYARLERGCSLTIAMGPATREACGDVCGTIVLGAPDSALIEAARDCTRAVCGYASGLKCVGELFIYADTWALNHGLQLQDTRSIGHALLPPEGRLASSFPHSTRIATWLRRHQIHTLNPRRLSGLWVLGPALSSGCGAVRFREVVLIQPGHRRILGRSGLDEIGVFRQM